MNNSDELKTKFIKLEADINISRNVDSKLSDRLIYAEQNNFANEQYSRRECLESSGIPPSVNDNELKTKILRILDEIDAPVDPRLVEYYHNLQSKGNLRKVILKLDRRKDARKVLLSKNQRK